MHIDEKLKQIREEKEKIENEFNRLCSLKRDFPNLEIHKNRWGEERLLLRDEGSKATDCEILNNCGCCSDSPIEVWPFTTYFGEKIYVGNSIPYCIGTGRYREDRHEYSGWESQMKKDNISNIVIKQSKDYLSVDNKDEKY